MINIAVGEVLRRSDVHEMYGGSRQGGITSSRKTPAVFLFTDPKKGAIHGYRDGWGKDGLYHYCGQGRVGDHTLTRSNLSLLRHLKEGRRVYLFESAGPALVRLVGEFAVDRTDPIYWIDGKDQNKEMRQMVIFRLTPLNAEPQTSSTATSGPDTLPATATTFEYSPLEKHLSPEFRTKHVGGDRVSERRESALVERYRGSLEKEGHTFSRIVIRPNGEADRLYTDLFDQTTNTLIEAKGNTSRPSVRMAVGQLLDYSRHIPIRGLRLGALFPARPRNDLRDFCSSLRIATIWEQGNTFCSEEPTSW